MYELELPKKYQLYVAKFSIKLLNQQFDFTDPVAHYFLKYGRLTAFSNVFFSFFPCQLHNYDDYIIFGNWGVLTNYKILYSKNNQAIYCVDITDKKENKENPVFLNSNLECFVKFCVYIDLFATELNLFLSQNEHKIVNHQILRLLIDKSYELKLLLHSTDLLAFQDYGTCLWVNVLFEIHFLLGNFMEEETIQNLFLPDFGDYRHNFLNSKSD